MPKLPIVLARVSVVLVLFFMAAAAPDATAAAEPPPGAEADRAIAPTPMFSEYANVAAGVQGDAPTLVDVNGDERLDIVIVPGGSSTFNVVLNLEGANGDPTFTDLPTNPVGLPRRWDQQHPDRPGHARLQR